MEMQSDLVLLVLSYRDYRQLFHAEGHAATMKMIKPTGTKSLWQAHYAALKSLQRKLTDASKRLDKLGYAGSDNDFLAFARRVEQLAEQAYARGNEPDRRLKSLSDGAGK